MGGRFSDLACKQPPSNTLATWKKSLATTEKRSGNHKEHFSIMKASFFRKCLVSETSIVCCEQQSLRSIKVAACNIQIQNIGESCFSHSFSSDSLLMRVARLKTHNWLQHGLLKKQIYELSMFLKYLQKIYMLFLCFIADKTITYRINQ